MKNTPPYELAVSSITVMEIQYGLLLNTERKRKIETVIHDLISTITTLDYNAGDAAETASIRALLKKQGQPIGSYDILLAGVALNHQLILGSSNMKEFNRIPDLKIENWR
jgi:tRNA(fMet)-specific endonuclease VapC